MSLPSNRAPIIVATDVGKVFARGSQLALAGVDLEIKAGEFLCIVGPSGCGKSTFLFIVAGLVPLSFGRIKIEGRPIQGQAATAGSCSRRARYSPGCRCATTSHSG